MFFACVPSDCQDLPQHCRGQDRKKCYNTNPDRPQNVFGKENYSVWAKHDKLKITDGQLKTWHESIDQSYLVKINHSVLKILHNAIYPTGKTNTK